MSRNDDHDYVAYPIEKGPGVPLQSSSPTNDDDPLNDVSLGPNPATYEFLILLGLLGGHCWE